MERGQGRIREYLFSRVITWITWATGDYAQCNIEFVYWLL